jgi:hypothetical protein
MTTESPLGWQVILRLTDGRVIAPRVAQRRLVTRMVHRHGRDRALLAFCVVGDHVHVLLLCSRVEAGRFAHAIETSLRHVLELPVSFEAARIRPIDGQRHLESVYRYVARQAIHHRFGGDPLLDGNSVADVWGLRALGDELAVLASERLPTVRIGAAEVGLSLEELLRATPRLDELADAAAAAMSIASPLATTRAAAIARRCAVHAALAHGATVAAVAELLGTTPARVQRLRNQPATPRAVRAVELQLRLRGLLALRSAGGATLVA